MSSSIDERIVRLQFDNKSFRENAEDSLKALEAFDNQAKKMTKSKGLLDLSNASKSMKDLGDSANKINLNGLLQSIESVSSGLSKLGSFGHRILENLADDAYRYGKQMVKSLTIDQVSAGYDKYEEKTSAVQTIMAATAKDFKDQGEQMEYVNGQLSKLQWFTDETSYNFNDMVSSIGKFTGSGVKLDDAVSAMQGVATWAAKSGVNATRASGAYYNLSQAIGLGYVQLMDWRSIQNLNMDTMEFKEQVLETAVAMGKLTKTANGTYMTLNKHEVTASNFANYLSDQWFTSDVLMDVLGKYGMASEKLYDVTQDLGLTATEMLGYIEDYQNGSLDLAEVADQTGVKLEDLTKIFEEFNTEEMKFSLSALRAAQEAKTFSEALDATKDAVSSQWSQTFELIFGDYQQAKKLWSMTAEYLWDIFASSGEARNELLQGWKELGGQDSIFAILENSFESISRVMGLVKDAWESVFPPTTAERLYAITEKIRAFTENLKNFLDYTNETTVSVSENGDEILKTESRTQKWSATMKNVSKILQGVFSTIKIGINIIKGIGQVAWNFLKEIFPKNGGILDALGNLGDTLTNLSKKIESSNFFQEWQENLAPVAQALSRTFTAIKDSLVELWTNIKSKFANSEVFNKAGKAIKDFFSSFFKQKLPGWIDSVTSWITTNVPVAINKIVEFTESAVNFFKTNEQVQKVWASISGFFSDFKAKAGDFFKVVGEAFTEAYNVDTSGYDSFADKIKARLQPLKKIYDWIKLNIFGIADDGEVSNAASKIQSFFKSIFEALKNGWNTITGNIAETGTNIANGFKGFISKIVTGFNWIKDQLKEIDILSIITPFMDLYFAFKSINIFSNFSSAAKTFADASLNFSQGFKSWLKGKGSPQKTPLGENLKNIGVAVALIAGSIAVLSLIKKEDIVKALLTLTAIGAVLVALTALPKLINKGSGGDLGNFGKGMAKLAGSLLIMSLSLIVLSKISWDTFLDGAAKLGALLLELGIFSRLSKGNGAGKGFTSLALSILIFTAAIKIFASMDWGTIAKGMGVLTIMLAVLTLFMRFSGGTGSSMGKFSQFLGLAALIGVLTLSLKSIGKMKFTAILKGIAGLSGVLLALLGIMKIAGKSVKLSGMIVGLIGIAGSIFAFYLLIKNLQDAPESKIAAIAGGFTAMMGGLSLMAGAFKIISTIPLGGAVLGSLGFMAIVAIIAAATTGLAELYNLLGETNQEQVLTALENFGTFIGKIGAVFGQFLGGFAGGFSAGFTAYLPGVGTNLSEFMTNADPFFQALGKIDGTMVKGAGNLALIYGSITLSSLVDWFLSGAGMWDGPVKTFAKNLAPLAEALVAFVSAAGDIDTGKVNSAAEALNAIATIDYPDNHVIENIIGVSDMAAFADKLGKLGLGLVQFAIATLVTPFSNVEKAASALSSITTVDYPDNHVIENIIGVSDMSSFADNLGKLGLGLAQFAIATLVAPFNNIEKAASALSAIATVDYPDNSVIENIIGVSDMGTFASKLGQLGRGLAQFAWSTAFAPFNNVEKAKKALDLLGEFAKTSIPDTSIFENIINVSDMGNFATKLGPLGEGLATFFNSTKNIFTGNAEDDKVINDKIESVLGIGKLISAFAVELPNNSFWENLFNVSDLSNFANNMGSLGSGIKDFYNNLGENLDYTYMTEAVDFLTKLSGPVAELAADRWIAGNLSHGALNFSQLSNFGKNASSFAEGIKTIFTSLAPIEDEADKASSVITKFSSILEIISTFAATNVLYREGMASSAAKKYNFSALKDFGNNAGKFGQGINDLVKAFKGTDLTDIDNIATSIKKVIPSIAKVYDDALKIDKNVNVSAFKSLGEGLSGFLNNVLDFSGTDIDTRPLKDLALDPNVATAINNFAMGASSAAEAYVKLSQIKDLFQGRRFTDLGVGLEGFVSHIPTLLQMTTTELNNVQAFSTLMDSLVDVFSGDFLTMTEEDLWESNWAIFINNMVTTITSSEDFTAVGTAFATKLTEALSANQESLNTSGANIAISVANSMSNQAQSAYTAGYNLVAGFANGIAGNSSMAANAAAALGRLAVTSLNYAIASRSPSREALKSGNYFGEGFQIGIKNYADTIQNDSYRLGSEAVNGLVMAVAQAKNVLETGAVDMNPVISPVLDLSNVQESARGLNDMLYFDSVNIPASLGNSVNAFRGNINNPDLYFERGSMSNSDIVAAVNGVQDEVSTMKDAMTEMGIFLDGKQLVGGIKDRMNTELGAQSRRDGRRN